MWRWRPQQAALSQETKERALLKSKYEALADKAEGIYFVGRLATYKYYNMDQVVAQALTTYKKINGSGERRTELAGISA